MDAAPTLALGSTPQRDLASMTKDEAPFASAPKDLIAAALGPEGLTMPKGFAAEA